MYDWNKLTVAGARIAFLTLGCKVNSYETEAMQKIVVENGAEIVDFEDTADIYVVNTCSVTNMADRKSRQMIHKAKKMNPDAIIAAAGCYVQTADEESVYAQGVDVIIGNNRKKDIALLLNEFLASGKADGLLDISKEKDYEQLSIETVTEKTRAYIKIQDGCNQFCSYCIIPYARGRIRSRKEDDILKEVTELAAKGYKEIVLAGIHISSYGKDESMYEKPFLHLIGSLNQIDGIERIRLGSLEPRIVTEDFVKELVGYEKVCPHFHLSLQSGCDNTLRRMNRKYTAQEYYEGVMLLRKYFDNPAITTDIIVGFPQETEEDFEECLEFARKIKFSKIHVFKYSRRKGTVADKMPGQIDEEVKSIRSDRLLAVNSELEKEYEVQFFNTKQKVLFEDEMEHEGVVYQTGHNERYVRVAYPCSESLSNEIREVEVTDRVIAGKETDILIAK